MLDQDSGDECAWYEDSSNAFRDALRSFLTISGNDRVLASTFEVGVSTPVRWSRGITWPHPLLQQQIMNFICDRSDVW